MCKCILYHLERRIHSRISYCHQSVQTKLFSYRQLCLSKPLDSSVSSRKIHFTIFLLVQAMSPFSQLLKPQTQGFLQPLDHVILQHKCALPVDTQDSKKGLNRLKVRTLTVIRKTTSKLITSLHQWIQKAYPRTLQQKLSFFVLFASVVSMEVLSKSFCRSELGSTMEVPRFHLRWRPKRREVLVDS